MTIRGVPDLNDLRARITDSADQIKELDRVFMAIRAANLDPDRVNPTEVARLTREAGAILSNLTRLAFLVWQAAELERAGQLDDLTLTEEKAHSITGMLLIGRWGLG